MKNQDVYCAGGSYLKSEPEQEYKADVEKPVAANELTEDQILVAARRIARARLATGKKELTSPTAVRNELEAAMLGYECEHFGILFLDTQHRSLGYNDMFRGSISSCSIPVREIVKESLAVNASAVILVHNHPGGLAMESRADRAITRKIKDALDLVDVRVLDHFVVTGSGDYTSFAQKDLL